MTIPPAVTDTSVESVERALKAARENAYNQIGRPKLYRDPKLEGHPTKYYGLDLDEMVMAALSALPAPNVALSKEVAIKAAKLYNEANSWDKCDPSMAKLIRDEADAVLAPHLKANVAPQTNPASLSPQGDAQIAPRTDVVVTSGRTGEGVEMQGGVNLVEQQNASDCAPCCIAMLTGMSREDVISGIGDLWNEEKGFTRDIEALVRLGFHEDDIMQFHEGHNQPQFVQQQFKHLAWKRKALITVPSLNKKGGWHMVYYDGDKVYDPNPSHKLRYESWDDLEPVEIIIFNERALAHLPTEAAKDVRVLVEAAKRVLIGGNHVTLLIGSNHPLYTATDEMAQAFYLPHHQEKYEAWICWRTIMQLRDALSHFYVEKANG